MRKIRIHRDIPPPGKHVIDVDGLPIGLRVNHLSDKEGGEERLIKNQPIVDDSSPYSIPTKFYGRRSALRLDDETMCGTVCDQLLVNYLGDPAWINKSSEDVEFDVTDM